jgi:SOS-response transcriptional repressor LexA
MAGANIQDGDFALLKRAKDAENGEIMLVRHDDSSTLKRIKITEDEWGKKRCISAGKTDQDSG